MAGEIAASAKPPVAELDVLPALDIEANVLSAPCEQRKFVILDVEVDPQDVEDCRRMQFRTDCSGSDIQLLTFGEIPHFMQYNVDIRNGYVVNLSLGQCIRSIFMWTNETVNVWSHLGAFFVFAGLLVVDNAIWLPACAAGAMDHLVMSVSLLCFQATVLSSAGYHTFRCHSPDAFRRWLALDQSGVCLGLLGCYLPCVHIGFRCFLLWRTVYTSVCTVVCLSMLVVSLRARTAGARRRRLLLPMYCCLALCGIVPSAHWVVLCGGLQANVVATFLGRLVVMYGIGVLAFVFYVSKFPECCCPGTCDYFGSSHNWWHILVALGMLWMHHCSIEFLQHWHRLGSAACAPATAATA